MPRTQEHGDGWESAQEMSGHQPACPPLNAAKIRICSDNKSHAVRSSVDVYSVCGGSLEASVKLFFIEIELTLNFILDSDVRCNGLILIFCEMSGQ